MRKRHGKRQRRKGGRHKGRKEGKNGKERRLDERREGGGGRKKEKGREEVEVKIQCQMILCSLDNEIPYVSISMYADTLHIDRLKTLNTCLLTKLF